MTPGRSAITRAGLAALALIAVVAGPAWPDPGPPERPAPTRSAGPPERLVRNYRRPAAIPFPADNAYTKDREALGRTLFFDPRLSSSNGMSCSTCHDPARSWSDGRPRAVGLDGKTLARRTPTILNLAWTRRLFRDGRVEGLEAQAAQVMQSPDEMNQSPDAAAVKLRAADGYQTLFDRAYPGEGITGQTIVKALATFQRTVVSGLTPFDAWIAGNPDAISAAAQRGLVVFTTRGNCVICHSGWNFADGLFHDTGLPSPDLGRGALLAIPTMQFAFRTPTLRDVEHRAPYMHDGSLPTLDEVVEFYDRGGEVRPSRSPEVRPLRLSVQDKADLVAFMKALTTTGTPTPVVEPPR
jgi:cytochrome c peroxidase